MWSVRTPLTSAAYISADEGIGPSGHLKPIRNPWWERGFLGFWKRLGRDEEFILTIAIPYKFAL